MQPRLKHCARALAACSDEAYGVQQRRRTNIALSTQKWLSVERNLRQES